MNSIISVRAQWEPLRSVGSAAITAAAGNYVALGTPLVNPSRQLKITNNTDTNVIITDDVTITAGKLIIIAKSFDVIDITTNRSTKAETLEKDALTQFYVRLEDIAAPANVGKVYMSTLYSSQS